MAAANRFGTSARRRGVPEIHWPVAALLLTIGLSGCAMWPQFGPQAEVGPPAYLANMPGSGADSTTAARPTPVAAKRTPTPRTEGNGTRSTTNPLPSTPVESGAPANGALPRAGIADSVSASAASADTAGAPRVDVRIDLPESERSRLYVSAFQDIDAAEEQLKVLAARRLTLAESEKQQTVRSLLAQSKEALGSNDVEAAANLARKARLLANELTAR